MDQSAWGSLADQGAAFGLMVLFISGFVRGWWITGREAERERQDAIERLAEMRADRDFWRSAADRAGGLAETAVAAPAPRRRRSPNAETR